MHHSIRGEGMGQRLSWAALLVSSAAGTVHAQALITLPPEVREHGEQQERLHREREEAQRSLLRIDEREGSCVPRNCKFMHADMALRMMADLFWTGLLICAPVLGLTMLVGLLISILQVVTQVQEMALSFVPKLVTAAMAMVFFGPWMLGKLAQFTVQLWLSIPRMF